MTSGNIFYDDKRLSVSILNVKSSLQCLIETNKNFDFDFSINRTSENLKNHLRVYKKY